MTMSMQVGDRSVPEQRLPTTVADMSVVVDEVTSDRVRMSFEYTAMGTEGAGDLPAAAVAQMDDLVAQVEGTTGWWTTTPRGVFLGGSIDPPAGLDPALANMLDQMEQQLSSMTVPVPSQPVGPGATWEGDFSFELSGLRMENTARYTVVEFDGNRYVLDVKVEQRILPGPVELPSEGAGGATAEVVEGAFDGGGRVQGTLDSSLPEQLEMHTTGAIVMTIEAEGQSQELRQNMAMDIRMTSSPAST